MRTNRFLILLLSALLFFAACHSTKQLTENKLNVTDPYAVDTEITVYPEPGAKYQPSYPIVNDIVSTKLEVSFDWEKQRMPGKSTIVFHPHFYPTDSLTLDAKGFDIHKIEIVTPKGNKLLTYTYDSSILRIKLDTTYTRNDNYTIRIDYTAKPNERKTTGSPAITDSKGLYFINPKGEEPDKPKQIWTQGETENNSAWFPTVDKPNMKTTIEIFMKVDTQYVTLSNGLMLDSKNNNDGTRTDHWKLDQPIAPYLVMMAVGKFSVVKDKWRDMEVNYYVEPKYAKYAKEIFGDTPKMMEFYSNMLGVDYVWPKFSQVVVRDFVSGAMENVSAVVHYSALQQTHREMIDGNHEDIISHELFHHWFGDLVTCESWANLPLNESFADYGESMWLRYKYGNAEADYHVRNDLDTYIAETEKKPVPLIRYYYTDKEQMFDANSYQKGGAVLNLLRTYIGDSAFYKSLRLYLTKNKFRAAEIHQLRLAFEEVTGQDLNWFFNQWFLDKGHPSVTINYSYDAAHQEQRVTIEQTQSFAEGGWFQLPLKVDLYFGKEVRHYNVVMDKQHQTFTFPAQIKPDLVNVDADKSMVWEKADYKTDSAFIFQYNNAPRMLDRWESVEHFKERTDATAQQFLLAAMHDNFWRIRKEATIYVNLNNQQLLKDVKANLFFLLKADPESQVRAAALKRLSELNDKTLLNVFNDAMSDSSYLVLATALDAIASIDMNRAYESAQKLVAEDEGNIVFVIASIFAEKGTAAEQEWFIRQLNMREGFQKFSLYGYYGKFLQRLDIPEMNKGLDFLYHSAVTERSWWIRYVAMNAIIAVTDELQERKDLLKTDNSAEAKSKIDLLDTQIKTINKQIETIKAQEKDETLKSIYENH